MEAVQKDRSGIALQGTKDQSEHCALVGSGHRYVPLIRRKPTVARKNRSFPSATQISSMNLLLADHLSYLGFPRA